MRFFKILIGCIVAYFSYGIIRTGIAFINDPELAEMGGTFFGVIVIILGLLGILGSIVIIRKALKQRA